MRLPALLVAGTLALSGCGSGTAQLLHPGSRSRSAGGAPAASVRVIRGWADALRSGRVRAAATYFRIPSVFFSGAGPPLEIRSRAEAEIANAALPCGARLISTRQVGRYVNALFALTDRPGRGGAGGCGSGSGATARTNFLIEGGRIVEWLRAPDEPGDNGTPRTGPRPPSPTVPTSPTTPGATGTAIA